MVRAESGTPHFYYHMGCSHTAIPTCKRGRKMSPTQTSGANVDISEHSQPLPHKARLKPFTQVQKKKKKEIVLAPKANPKYTNVECHMQRHNIFGPNSSVPGGPVSRLGPCNVKQRTPGVTKDSEAPSAEALPSTGSPAQTNPNTKEVQQALDQ